jgi:hypothetical protein
MSELNISIPQPLVPPNLKSIQLSARTTGLNFVKAKVLSFRLSPNDNVAQSRADTEIKEISALQTNTPLRTSSQIGNKKIGQFIIKTNENVQIGTERTSFENGEGYIILETAIGSISQDRTIITTAIQGRNGTVKEYISDGDFKITITGKIVDSENRLPNDQLSDIANIFKAQNEIVIVSDFLFNFDIKNVVVKSYSIDQVEGADNLYTFSLELLSDDAIELKLGIIDA